MENSHLLKLKKISVTNQINCLYCGYSLTLVHALFKATISSSVEDFLLTMVFQVSSSD